MKNVKYPNLTIIKFPIKKYPYVLLLKTKGGKKIIADCIQTIEQAQEIANNWAEQLQIPIYQHEIQAA